VYFFNTLLQAVDHYADFDNPDAVDQLRVVCVKMLTEMMTVDQALKVLGVRNNSWGPGLCVTEQ